MPERWPDGRVVLQGELPNPAHRPHRLCFTHCSRADGAMRENPFWTNIITWCVCSCRRLSRSEETVEYAEKNMIYFLSTRFIRRLLTVFCVIRFAFILCACQLTLRKSYSGLKLYKAIAVFHKQWGAGCAIMATILHLLPCITSWRYGSIYERWKTCDRSCCGTG